MQKEETAGKHDGKTAAKTGWENLRRLSRTILDYGVCIYLILMLGVFPFYNEEGYSHIGTDKAAFFCRIGVGAGKILLIPLALYVILSIFHGAASGKFAPGRIAAVFRRPAEGGKRIFQLTSADYFALVYCAALALSYIFTDYREDALWGARGWYMGFFPQLMLVGIYFLVSRFWKPRRWLFYIIFPVSGAVFLMGCMNRFGFYSFGLESAGTGFISTIGNQNWYCGYAVSVVFAGSVLLWLGEKIKAWQRALLIIYTAVGYLSLVLQGSDSGLVALTVVILVLFCLSVKDDSRMLAFWEEMTILSVECLGCGLLKYFFPNAINFYGNFEEILISIPIASIMTLVSFFALAVLWADRKRGKYRERLFRILARTAVAGSVAVVLGILLLAAVNTRYPGSLGPLSKLPLFTFNERWGSSRGATWSAGWKCFASQDALHKLVGVGPDCMWSFISSGKQQELYDYVNMQFGGLRLTNAHNEWLTVLVNTGLIGFVGYGGLFVCGIRELFRKGKENPIAMACGFSLLAYTVNHIFSFQQAAGVGTVFVVFGMGMAFAERNVERVRSLR